MQVVREQACLRPMHSRDQSSKAPLVMLAPDLRLLPEHPGDPVPENGEDREPSGPFCNWSA
eukprot:4463015-Pyramimonas_sp.AAC.1